MRELRMKRKQLKAEVATVAVAVKKKEARFVICEE